MVFSRLHHTKKGGRFQAKIEISAAAALFIPALIVYTFRRARVTGGRRKNGMDLCDPGVIRKLLEENRDG